jgi:hypothetical protein
MAKTVGDVLRELGKSPTEFALLIEPATMMGEVRMQGRLAGLYDYVDLEQILSPDHIEAAANCDGTCPGCVEGDGAGCDAIAVFCSTPSSCSRRRSEQPAAGTTRTTSDR